MPGSLIYDGDLWVKLRSPPGGFAGSGDCQSIAPLFGSTQPRNDGGISREVLDFPPDSTANREQTSICETSMDLNALNGLQRATLHKALLSAFAKPELSRLLSHGDKGELDTLVSDGSLEDQVFDLVALSQRDGWTDWLVEAILAERPKNSLIRTLMADLEAADASKRSSRREDTRDQASAPSIDGPHSRSPEKAGEQLEATDHAEARVSVPETRPTSTAVPSRRTWIAIAALIAISAGVLVWFFILKPTVIAIRPGQISATVTYTLYADPGERAEGGPPLLPFPENMFVTGTSLYLAGGPPEGDWPPTAWSEQLPTDKSIWVQSGTVTAHDDRIVPTVDGPNQTPSRNYGQFTTSRGAAIPLLVPTDSRFVAVLIADGTKPVNDWFEYQRTVVSPNGEARDTFFCFYGDEAKQREEGDFYINASAVHATLNIFVDGAPLTAIEGIVARVTLHDEDVRRAYITVFWQQERNSAGC